jgi:hypothetical protein
MATVIGECEIHDRTPAATTTSATSAPVRA